MRENAKKWSYKVIDNKFLSLYFTPIKNVKYEVENVRIGDKNDYEKLMLEISTDGSITPDDALTQAAKILRDHIQL